MRGNTMVVKGIEFESKFENVYIYVADALRYDFVPPSFADKYDVIQTVAGGILSPPGFASLLTGRYPSSHGVYGFKDRLSPEFDTLFTAFRGLETGFVNGGGQVGEVLGKRYEIADSITEFSEPFIVMERDLLTHAPYAKEQKTELPGSNERYWRSICKDRANMISDYQYAARFTFKRFENRISILDRKDLLEDTLVIFTSDHGEALGEHGIVGHGFSMTPETVYVPTIIYNPDVRIESELISHVDILPLIAEALDEEVKPSMDPNVKLEGESGLTPVRLCMSKSPDINGVWGSNGGIVFVEEGLHSNVKWVASKLFVSGAKAYMRRRPVSILAHGLRHGISSTIVHGNPSFGAEAAETILDEAMAQPTERLRRDLSEEARERLEELGYVEQARE